MEAPRKQRPDKLDFAVENKESNFRDVCKCIQRITKACLNNKNDYNTHTILADTFRSEFKEAASSMFKGCLTVLSYPLLSRWSSLFTSAVEQLAQRSHRKPPVHHSFISR